MSRSADGAGIAPSGAAAAGTVDFFATQDTTARRAHRLFALVLVCAALVVVSVDLWVGVIAGYVIAHQMALEGRDVLAGEPPWHIFLVVPLQVYAASTAVTLAIMVAAMVKRERELRQGSAAFAAGLGARAVDRDHPYEQERALVNVADEMALAAQLLPPALYVLDAEQKINALAVESGPDDTAVILTQAAVLQLSRPEQQVLIAYALGRARNGDIALNTRLIGWLAGLTAVGGIGTWLMRVPSRIGRAEADRDREASDLTKAALAFSLIPVMIGAVIAVIGYAGFVCARWLRALGARQRVLLADATALQFTRDPAAATALLRRLERAGVQRLTGRYREEVGPLLFVPAVGWRCLATHPSAGRRIAALTRGARD